MADLGNKSRPYNDESASRWNDDRAITDSIAVTRPHQMGTYHMVNHSGFEPQRTNNFEVQIAGLSKLKPAGTGKILDMGKAGQLITLSVASYAAPQINVSSINIAYGNNKVKFAGLPEFPDSQIVLNDFIGIDVENILSTWQSCVYNPSNQCIGLAKDYKKTAYLHEYDPAGTNLRSWELDGVWLSNLQLGDFNQEGNASRQITCTLIYDRAIPVQNYADRAKFLDESANTIV